MIIINKSLEMGQFPSAFKTSIVKSICKIGERDEMTNYRPISLITCLSKILEKVVNARFNTFLDKYQLISGSQYGFQKCESTNDALLEVTNILYKNIDEGLPTIAVFLDLAKAFDTVDHCLLLETLEDIGVRGVAHAFFKSYLTNRFQKIRVGNKCSKEQTVECGVPQGTVLGPVLFNIYLNNLFMIESNSKIISFADDTVLVNSDQNWYDLKLKIENDLNCIKQWFDYRLLSINYKKTVYLPFASLEPDLPNYAINVHKNANIQPAKQIKYLGMMIDPHLRWDNYINYVVQKLRYVLYKFKHISYHLQYKQKLMVYKSLIENLT